MAVNKASPQTLAAGTWEDLGGEDLTSTFTFQNVGSDLIWLYAGTSLPSGGPQGFVYGPGFGQSDLTLSELFPGLGSPLRLYGFAPVGSYYTLSAD